MCRCFYKCCSSMTRDSIEDTEVGNIFEPRSHPQHRNRTRSHVKGWFPSAKARGSSVGIPTGQPETANVPLDSSSSTNDSTDRGPTRAVHSITLHRHILALCLWLFMVAAARIRPKTLVTGSSHHVYIAPHHSPSLNTRCHRLMQRDNSN